MSTVGGVHLECNLPRLRKICGRAKDAPARRRGKWAGYQVDLDNPFRFAPIGLDVQPFIPLFREDRVLRLRFRVSAAVGQGDRIPFLDLPTLGGANLLRGDPRERFRGRVSVLSTAECRYPVNQYADAYLFVDVGRVYDEVSELSLQGMRLGYGGGLLVFGRPAFWLRLHGKAPHSATRAPWASGPRTAGLGRPRPTMGTPSSPWSPGGGPRPCRPTWCTSRATPPTAAPA